LKAITIHQPWASLIAIEAKRFETRGWKTNYRGPIAIHAGKQKDVDTCLLLAGENVKLWREITPLQFGSVIAIAELTGCYEIHIDHTGDAVLLSGNVPVHWIGKGSNEFKFGWYGHGRYAWELTNVRQIEHIPAKGQQGLWNWNHPIRE
jgi:hypothetical protein